MPTSSESLEAQDLTLGITDALASRLLHDHGAMVKAACRRILRDEALAEDAAQEVFILLARKARSLPRGTLLEGWLYRTACNIAATHRRTNMRREQREAAAMLDQRTLSEDNASVWSDLEPQLDEAMGTLPERQRDLIVRCYFQGRNQRETATQLSWSESKVSRELSAAIESLRAWFKQRGIAISSVGIVALLSTHAAQGVGIAASATVVSTMIATTASTTSSAFISTLLAMKMKLALAVGAVLLVSVVGYDLASKDSWLQSWVVSQPVSSKASSVVADKPQASSPADPSTERWLAGAREIWAKTPKIDSARLKEVLSQMLLEPDEEKQLALLRSIGVTISRAAYRSVVGGPKELAELRDYSFFPLLDAWAKESPREAMAWGCAFYGTPPSKPLWSALDAILAMPGAWDAFMKTAPDGHLAARFELWKEEAADPGSSWANAAKGGVTPNVVRARLGARIANDPPEVALRALIRCPDERTRNRGLMGLSLKLSKEQMLSLAEHEFAGSASAANWLRAMAGDPSASFSQALDMTHGVIYTNRHEPFVQYFDDDRKWALAGAREVFAQWLAIDAVAATNRGTTEGEGFTASFMEAAVRSGKINEAMIHDALSFDPKERDRALAFWYQALSGDDPHAALQRILDSPVIDDEIEAAKPILDAWALKSSRDAAAWLKSLPASKDHGELAAEIANRWINTEPEAAIAFALEQGMGLNTRHGIDTAATYLSKAGPEATTTFLRHFQGDERYNELVMHAASWKFMSDPTIGVTKEKIQYIADHAEGDWQAAAVEFFGMFVPAGVPNVKPYETMLLSFDLTRQDPKHVAGAAELLVKSYNGIGKVADGLNMTLQLPAAAAALAREGVASTIDISNLARRTALLSWIQSAAISESERAQLVQVLNHRTTVKAP